MLPSSVQILGGRPVLDVGRLVHSITIKQKAQLSPIEFDAAGPKYGWTTFTTARSSMESPSGGETNKGGQITTQLDMLIAMWWVPGILPSMRVEDESGSVFEVQSVENVLKRNLVLVLNCVGVGSNT